MLNAGNRVTPRQAFQQQVTAKRKRIWEMRKVNWSVAFKLVTSVVVHLVTYVVNVQSSRNSKELIDIGHWTLTCSWLQQESRYQAYYTQIPRKIRHIHSFLAICNASGPNRDCSLHLFLTNNWNFRPCLEDYQNVSTESISSNSQARVKNSPGSKIGENRLRELRTARQGL